MITKSSVSQMGKNGSKSDNIYFDPLTATGFPLQDGAHNALQLHECGALLMDHQWNYSEVRSPFWRAYYNLDHGAGIRISGRHWALEPDRLFILPENLRYDCLGKPGVRHLWVHFSVNGWIPSSVPNRPGVIHLDGAKQAAWRRLHKELTSKSSASVFSLRHRCAGLLHLAWAEIPELARAAEGSPRLRLFIDWLDRCLDKPPDVAAMAMKAGLERRSFLRWFSRETGRTPGDFLMERRIREACRQLRYSAASIEQIAEDTGFANRHHFSRAFRQRTGCTPAHFRKN